MYQTRQGEYTTTTTTCFNNYSVGEQHTPTAREYWKDNKDNFEGQLKQLLNGVCLQQLQQHVSTTIPWGNNTPPRQGDIGKTTKTTWGTTKTTLETIRTITWSMRAKIDYGNKKGGWLQPP